MACRLRQRFDMAIFILEMGRLGGGSTTGSSFSWLTLGLSLGSLACSAKSIFFARVVLRHDGGHRGHLRDHSDIEPQVNQAWRAAHNHGTVQSEGTTTPNSKLR
eukprot:symbB.v1.2.019142.t1/scaffold1553.1/size112120/4